MRRLAFLGLALALAVVIHIDWHFALPKDHPYSLSWPQHWIFAALAFFAVGWLIARIWTERPELTAMWVTLLAIVIAQGLVPVLEVALSQQRLGYPSDPLRWSGFFVCIGVGLPALFAAARLFRSRTGTLRSPSAA
jgi:hypothetical protein